VRKRYRQISAKPGQLIAAFGRDGVSGNKPDLIYSWGGQGAGRSDTRLLMRAFEELEVFEGRTLRQELSARGYDIESLRFSVRRKGADNG